LSFTILNTAVHDADFLLEDEKGLTEVLGSVFIYIWRQSLRLMRVIWGVHPFLHSSAVG
jgi:hypothetical protein